MIIWSIFGSHNRLIKLIQYNQVSYVTMINLSVCLTCQHLTPINHDDYGKIVIYYKISLPPIFFFNLVWSCWLLHELINKICMGRNFPNIFLKILIKHKKEWVLGGCLGNHTYLLRQSKCIWLLYKCICYCKWLCLLHTFIMNNFHYVSLVNTVHAKISVTKI